MAGCDQSMRRKRSLPDPCSSPQSCSKYAKTLSTCSPPSSPPSTRPPFAECDPSPSSSDRDCATFSSDPFPRYSLDIPHLDVLLPFSDGLDLLHAYHQGIGWIYTPVDRTTLLETLEQAERHGADAIHPHRLACLLTALALGDLFSSCFSPLADASPKRGRIWFGVASACLAGSRKPAELMLNPTPDACSALYLMSTYLLCSNDEHLFYRSQGLTGLALILAKSALIPACVASDQTSKTFNMSAPSVASKHQLDVSASSASLAPTATDQDRLHCTRLLTDLIFHLRCQVLTFALPCTFGNTAAPDMGAPLTSFPDVPTIQAIWMAFGTPLYASIDAFGSRYSPNIFHNWKLGLADLMHQVSTLTNHTATLDNLASPFAAAQCGLDAGMLAGKLSEPRNDSNRITLPEHGHVVKLDERIRRYHASLPEFLLLHKPLPIEMAGKVDEDELAQIICQRHVACSMIHRMLMALHRPWFLSALAGRARAPAPETGDAASQPCGSASEPTCASAHQPSPSAVFSLSAVLRSATWQTETYASATACAPPQALAWWQFTNNALAAAVVQATALLRLSCPPKASSATAGKESPAAHATHPSSHFHTQVRTDLDKNICSFQNVAKRCKLAAKALPFLQRVRSAIDLGICRSRGAGLSGQDALQSSVLVDEACREEEHSSASSTSSVSDIAAQKSRDNASDPFTCNNTSPRHRNSNSNSSSISTTSSANSTSHSNTASTVKNALNHTANHRETLTTDPPSSSSSTWTAPHHSTQDRRASSAKSELEAIFGPLASGLELSAAPAPPQPVKPLYRQSWEPIPLPPSRRPSDDQISQPAPSDDAGSSASSFGTFPHTPRSGSPQLNSADTRSASDAGGKTGEAAGAAGAAGQAEESGRKKPTSASDIVLECIRFWQPEMLATPSSASRRS
ncbi:conserved hypothetical protein [Sporisorium reilianum SRZ2]|uniref:Transcription factor domain-containing protein n=1 Tax=Sporisorium reilianum (strain SRZ2) TaxID=999809 RepID=E6ZZU4_SPORE|nr:conserved hypothetical protein [Sporisorium reilianum SRZ2]